jgi:hypothetical protein
MGMRHLAAWFFLVILALESLSEPALAKPNEIFIDANLSPSRTGQAGSALLTISRSLARLPP